MSVVNYFFKDTATGIYLLNGNAIAKGNYILTSFNNESIIVLTSKINEEVILGPVEINNIKKEDGTFYDTVSTILTENETFFFQETPVVISNIKYGRLYNGYAVAETNFAPTGWHVPTRDELTTLYNYVNANGGLLELNDSDPTYWNFNTYFLQGDNSFKFNLRGSGLRVTNFSDIKNKNYLISSTQSGGNAYIRIMGPYLGFTESIYALSRGECVRLIKDDSEAVDSLTDIDDNIYRACKIGNQVWLADNWACTKLNDGTDIPEITNGTTWSAMVAMARCNYNNDENNVFL